MTFVPSFRASFHGFARPVAIATLALAFAASSAQALPDLVAESVDASGASRECGTAEVSGSVSAVIRNDRVEAAVAAIRVWFFEDRNLDNTFDPAADQLLADVTVPPPAALSRTTVTASIGAQLAFSGAPIHVLVDATDIVHEEDENNNVTSSARPPTAPPCAPGPVDPWDVSADRVLDWAAPVNDWTGAGTVLVAHATDDNADGKFDEKDVPTIVVHAGAGQNNLVVGFRADGTSNLFEIYTNWGNGAAAPTVGNIDADPAPEIITVGDRIIAFNNEGVLEWSGDPLPHPESCPPLTPPCPYIFHDEGAPIIANLDGRGAPEIILGGAVFSNRGRLLAVAPDAAGLGGPTQQAAQPAVADIDNDGDLELVAGGTVYSFDGHALHVERQIEGLDGWVALGNFDDDPLAEIVVATNQEVWLLDVPPLPPEGPGGLVPIWSEPWTPPNDAGWGFGSLSIMGAPTLRDLDGDGVPEILITGGSGFGAVSAVGEEVSDADRVLWEVDIVDNTRASSTAFDLDGDGQPEVMHSDGSTFRILDASDGSVLYSHPVASFGHYGIATPTVADVDNDGHADILVASYVRDGVDPGVYIFRNDSWMPARSTWNQLDYCVTNINDDGSIPRGPGSPWLLPVGNPANDYKCQHAPDAPSWCLPQPDATVSQVSSSAAPCGDEVELRAVIGNGGAATATDISVVFFSGDPSLGNSVGSEVVETLAPGAHQEVVVSTSDVSIIELFVVAEEAGDSDETNNECHALVGAECSPSWDKGAPTLVYEGSNTGNHADPVELVARLSVGGEPEDPPVPGVFVSFELGAATCRALTDDEGRARCWVTPTEVVSNIDLTVASDETPHWEAAATSPSPITFGVTAEAASLFYDAPTAIPAWNHHLGVSATLREDGAEALASKNVAFRDGVSGTPVGATTASDGQAEETLEDLDYGEHEIYAKFTGDDDKHAQVEIHQTVHVLGPQIMLTPLAQVGIAGATRSVVATILDDGTYRVGLHVRFEIVSGPSSSVAAATVDTVSGGIATWTYTGGSSAGVDVVRAWFDRDNDHALDSDEPSAEVSVHQYALTPTELSFTSTLSADVHDTKAVVVKLKETGGANIAGAAVEVTLDGSACRGITDGSGDLTCYFTIASNVAASPIQVAASYAGNATLAPATYTHDFTITREQVRVSVLSYTWTLLGASRQYAFTAAVTADGALPVYQSSVTFTLNGTNYGPYSTDINGLVTVGGLGLSPATYTITAASAASDDYAIGNSASRSLVVNSSTPTPGSWKPSSVPTTPTLNDVVPAGDGTALLTFTPYADMTAVLPTGFFITIDGTTKVTVSVAEQAGSGATSRYITNLSNGSSHSFTVTPVNDKGNGTATGSDSTTTHAIPAAPTGVTATPDPENDQIVVEWTDGNDGGDSVDHGYVLSLPDGAVDEVDTENEDAIDVDDCEPHVFRVRSHNSEGYGAWSAGTASVTNGEAPGEPQDPVVNAGDGSVTMYWTQPADLNCGDITHYVIQKNEAAFATTDPDVVVKEATSLTNGSEVDFRIRAENDFGHSDWVEFSATPSRAPDAPTALEVAAGNGAATVSWTPGGNGGSALTGHVAGVSPTFSSPEVAGTNARIVTGLTNGTGVTLSVKAVNARGESDAVDAEEEVVPVRHAEKATDLTIDDVGDEEVTLTWTQPTGADTGGARISSYIVTSEPDSGEHEATVTGTPSTVTYPVDGLLNGQAYVFFVRAVNEAVGEPGAESDPSDPATPRTTPGTPRGFIVSVAGDRILQATWAAPLDDGGAPIDGYVLHGESSNGGPDLDAAPVAGARKFVFTASAGYAPGKTYNFTLVAHNDAGDTVTEATSGPVTVATLPSAPTLGEAELGDESATASWTTLSGAGTGYADIVSYRVCPIPGDAPCVDVPPDATEGTVRELGNGNAYKLEVRGRNIVGLGAASITEDAVTPCGPPNPPWPLTAEVTDEDAITLTWEAPGWNGGAGIDDYDVSIEPGDVVSSGGPLTKTFTGLEACTQYTFKVRAISDGCGTSDWSLPVTKKLMPIPNAPENVVVIPGDTCALVRWDPPIVEEGDCTTVDWYVITLTGKAPIIVYPYSDCTLVRDLTNDSTPYDVDVVAVNETGVSADGYSGDVTPTPPTLVSISVEPSSVIAGDTATAYIQLDGVANPDGTTITVESDNGDAATPQSVIQDMECGNVMLTMPITTAGVPGMPVTVTLTATLDSVERTDTLVVSGPDDFPGDEDCLVRIESPEDGAEVTAYGTDVVATIDCDDAAFHSWTLVLCPADENLDCIPIADGTSEVHGDVIGQIDPTLLLNGEYSLQLSALDDADAPLAIVAHSITIAGQQKIGQFTMSFVDMTAPAVGLPVQVVRTYDSRDKRDGDFGVGWKLSMNDVRVERVTNYSTGWDSVTHGDLGAFGITQRCFEETYKHVVSVIFPDGRTYRFRPVVSRKQLAVAPCGWDTVIHGWMHFQPLGNTRGKLTPVTVNPRDGGIDPRQVKIDASTVNLYWEDGDDSFEDVTEWEPTEYQLETEDGTLWHVKEGEGLLEVTDRNGNHVEFSPTGITSNDVPLVTIARDGGGHVTSVMDPKGKYVVYTYDSGHLVQVHDRVATAPGWPNWLPIYTEFSYDDANHPDFVTGVEQIDNVGSTTPPPFTKTYFDPDTGRMEKVCQVVGATERCVDMSVRNLGHSQTITNLRQFDTVLEYDDRGNVTRRTDNAGFEWTTSYMPDDQPEDEEDPLHRVTHHEYDATGNLLSVENVALGEVTSFTWGEKQTLLTLTQPGMTATTFTYDDDGNLLTQTAPGDATTTYTVNDLGQVEAVKDPLDHVSTTTWDGPFMVEKTDAAGELTTFEHDGNGNVTRTIRVGERSELITENVCDDDNRLVETMSPGGLRTETVYDGFGRAWKTVEHLDEDTERTTENFYDDYGRLWLVKYPDGTGERYGFDVGGNRIREESRVPRDFSGDPPSGDPTDNDDLPVITRHGYDALDRPYKTCFDEGADIDSDESWDEGCTWQAFDDAGQLILSVDERSYATAFEYDDAGRQTWRCGPSEDPFNSINPNNLPDCDDIGPDIETRYDEDTGRVKWVKVPGLEYYQVPHYDATGRREYECKQLVADAGFDDPRDGNAADGVTCKHFEHDDAGRLVAETDENGKTTRYGLDELGRLVSVTDALDQVTHYSFDDFDNIATQTDARERVTHYEHDAEGRRKTRVLPLQQRETFGYGVTGALLTHRDFKGLTTDHAIDAATDRVTSIDYPSTPADPDVEFDYFGDGTRKEVEDDRGTTAYTREAVRGQLESVQSPDVPLLSYGRDASGNRSLTTTGESPSDHHVTYEYDGAGRIKAVIDEDGARADYVWDEAGRLQSVTYSHSGDEIIGTYTYDALTGALDTITWSTPDPGGEALLTIDYELDGGNEGSGRRTGVLEIWGEGGPLSTRTAHYTFDDLYRLTDEDYDTEVDGTHRQIHYDYDAVGNRLLRTVTLDPGDDEEIVSTYDADDRLLSAGDRWFGSCL